MLGEGLYKIISVPPEGIKKKPAVKGLINMREGKLYL